ncbi:glycosyltransferase [Cellulomonas marina]|uniref:Beta-1,4-mannosyltransferase n=1 Tax=Cellulomonas marina TaxID=988821 RepID=A0A1I0X604_9CELL|nr:glycosyltransferase [Cellulomonas marina]GIG28936.1 GDP-mannose:glycolipid 4-beta-D-mannosyltransferase [Cellulomonas marina]SFA95778.1 beta-1,4-mannosyltransferase&\
MPAQTPAPVPDDRRRRIRVLEELDPPDGTTRFVDQVTRHLDDDVEVDYFTWRKGLLSRYDVLHLHWPERLVRGYKRPRTLVNYALVLALGLRARLLRVAVVQTEHNLAPHERGGPLERAVMGWLGRQVTASIRLNRSTPPRPGAQDHLVPHGDYREPFAGLPRHDAVPGRLAYVGIIREYKGVDRLLAEFARLDDPDLTLRVVGRPADARWRALVEAAVAADPRVSARLTFVPDDELVAEVTEAELVVLPYAQLHNSGTLLVALSLGRPVLAPAGPAPRELQAEVGADWVRLYEGPLTAELVRAELDAVRGGLPGEPDLTGRDWPSVGARHAEVFRAAVTAARGARRSTGTGR